MNRIISRRRFLSISAMAGIYAAIPLSSVLASVNKMHHWRGILLGANVHLTLAHPSALEADTLFTECVQEIKRLEQLFTLYDNRSELSQLNQQGMLAQPSEDMVDILQQAKRYYHMTHGAFDVTVKPLEDGSGKTDIVGMDKLDIYPDQVRFRKTGMSVTLNGIAQGYITDRITTLLKNKGLRNVLVELGEKHAIGTHPSGRPWRVALKHSDTVAELRDQAMAFSSSVSPDTGNLHIFTPSSGKHTVLHNHSAVIAESATMADALSTGFLSLSKEDINMILAQQPAIVKAYMS